MASKLQTLLLEDLEVAIAISEVFTNSKRTENRFIVDEKELSEILLFLKANMPDAIYIITNLLEV